MKCSNGKRYKLKTKRHLIQIRRLKRHATLINFWNPSIQPIPRLDIHLSIFQTPSWSRTFPWELSSILSLSAPGPFWVSNYPLPPGLDIRAWKICLRLFSLAKELRLEVLFSGILLKSILNFHCLAHLYLSHILRYISRQAQWQFHQECMKNFLFNFF